jgi:hypothetical protein
MLLLVPDQDWLFTSFQRDWLKFQAYKLQAYKLIIYSHVKQSLLSMMAVRFFHLPLSTFSRMDFLPKSTMIATTVAGAWGGGGKAEHLALDDFIRQDICHSARVFPC